MPNNISSILAPICTDNTQNGLETDKDCGGGLCPKCADGLNCKVNNDCMSDICIDDMCQVGTCEDSVTNELESDKDCGGGFCPKCQD
ncbi:unnamed protein product, partial [Rotaria sordida]